MPDPDPLSWEDLIKYDNNPPDGALPRQESVKRRYGGYLGALKARGTNIEEDIMGRILKNHTEQRFIITKNDFPYYVDKNVSHMVLWVNPLFASPTDSAEETEKMARDFIMALISHEYTNDGIPVKVYSMFENNPKNRSVTNVRHFQLFIKNKNIGMLPVEKL